MRESEEFETFFIQHGVLYEAIVQSGDSMVGRNVEGECILRVSETEFWFNKAGKFVGTLGNDFMEWEPRKEGV